MIQKILGVLNASIGGAGVAAYVTYMTARADETLCITYDVAGYALMIVALALEFQRRAEPREQSFGRWR